MVMSGMRITLAFLFMSLCAINVMSFVSQRVRRVTAGVWGGDHLQMNVGRRGASAQLEFDCASGQITVPLTFDRSGRFSLDGTFTRRRGGPIRRNEQPDIRPARYEGSVNGKTITLTITLTETNESVGTYTLYLGRAGKLRRCL